MKRINYIILLAFLSSCQKYVDIQKTSTQSLIETANDCQLVIDNYKLFNADYPYDGAYSSDDYYVSAETYNDEGTSIEDRSIYGWEPNAIRQGSDQWLNAYRKIYHTNLVLETVAKLKGKEEAGTLDNLQGEALFLRAYALWNLAQLYIEAYDASTTSAPGLPIHLKSDINDVPGRGSVKDTYSRIVTDLKDAATLLKETSSVPSRPVKAAAYAMLARVYLSMEDYVAAGDAANSALKLTNTLMDYNTGDVSKSPFTNTPFKRYNKEVIFQSILAANTLLSSGNPVFNAAKISNDLVDAYDDKDLRKQVYFKPNEEQNEGTFRFTGNYEPTSSSTLFNGLAVDELYLVRAECYARAGNVSAAMDDLNTLLRTRWETGAYTDMSAADAEEALVKVLIERRKELVMRAQRWTDLRRLNKDPRFRTDLQRSVEVEGVPKTFNLPAGDSRYTLLIPQEVIANSAIPQNQR